MRRLKLSLAVGDYDITRPLIDGTVEPQGVELLTLHYPSPQRHWRMLVQREFDLCEMSLGSYVARRSRGQDDLVALLVFPHRRFRHGCAFASAARGISRPSQLQGERVGIRTWQTTAGIWLRGILAEHHGLPIARVRWIAQDVEDVPLDLTEGIQLDLVPEGERVTDLCARGEIAGLIYPELPEQVMAGDRSIERIFADPKQAELAYYKAAGIFPIMHVLVARTRLIEEHPWLALNLVDAFEAAKQIAARRLQDPRTVSLAWLRALQEEELAVLGSDPWRYGLDDANRNTLSTFMRYAEQQGVAATSLTPDDLFAAESLRRPPTYV